MEKMKGESMHDFINGRCTKCCADYEWEYCDGDRLKASKIFKEKMSDSWMNVSNLTLFDIFWQGWRKGREYGSCFEELNAKKEISSAG